MRLFLLIILCLIFVGCNADPRCRRETALLRAEILDLEDKYYLLKAERDALAEGQSTVTGQSYYTDTGEPFLGNEIIYDESNSGILVDENSGVILHGTTNVNSKRLPPDDSILPLNSNTSRHSKTLRNAPSVLKNENTNQEFSLQLPDNLGGGAPLVDTTSSGSDEIDVLLNAPEVSSGMEVGFENRQPSKPITEVVINRMASKGQDLDGALGDEGLDLLIQPRSSDGEIQLVGGELSVSLIDPMAVAAEQRIGTWKFLASETELFFANDELGSYGILLHLPWEQQTPVNKKLMVHVKFVTPDGRVLKTSTEIRIAPPGSDYSPNDPLVSGWTRSDSRWLGIASNPSSSNRGQKGKATFGSAQRPGNSGPRQIPARPAKAKINAPAWRPIR